MGEDASGIVVAEARRALDEQQAALGDARQRAGLVFTVAGITSSLLVGPALQGHQGWPALAAVGLGMWAAAALAAVAVLWPWEFRFSVHPLVLLGPGWSALDAERMNQQLGFVLGRNINFNHRRLGWLWFGVQGAMLFAAASVAPWIVLLTKGT